MIEGSRFDGAASYSFNVLFQGNTPPVALPPGTPLPLNSTVGGSISVALEQDVYTFTLATTTPVYFDSLTNNGTIFWSLTGPAGTVASSRAFTNSDSIDGSGTLNLIAGDYRLTVFGSGASTGDYSFRLLNLAAATPVTPGVPFSGTLNPANETDAYRFDVVGGEKIFFDVTANNNNGNARWRLLDPYLSVVFERDFANPASDVGPLTLTRPGTYTLLMEGRYFETTPSSYTVVMVPVSDELNPVPFALGTTINEAIDEPGEVDSYTFTLAAPASVYFDSLTSNSSIFWSLTGPAGTVAGSRAFTNSDSIDGSGTLNLIAGTYTLTIDGS